MEESSIDFRTIIRTLKNGRKLIIRTFLAFFVAGLAFSLLIPPTYEAETTIRVKQPKGLANSLLADLPMGNSAATKQLMSTYEEILKSRTVVQAVIDKTQGDKPVMPEYETMLGRITTQPVKDSEILKIKIKAKSPAEAQLIANTLVDTFIERLTGLARQEQTVVRQFIGERLQGSKNDLEVAERKLEQYKKEQQLVAPEQETKAMVDKLSEIDKLTAENSITLATAQARLGNAEQQLAGQKPGFIADNPLIEQYKAKLAELEVQLVTLSQNYTDKYPQVQATKAAIEETRNKLNTEIAKVVNAEAPSMNPVHLGLLQSKLQSEAEIAAATAQKQALDGILVQGESEMTKLPAKEKGLAKVMRDAALAQDIYTMLAKRYEEARISEVMQPTDVQVVDVAPLPKKPVSPKIFLNLIIASILGLMAGIALAMAKEYLNKTIRTADDVSNYLDLPVLGNIPDFNSGTEDKKRGNARLWDRILHITANKNHGG